MRLTNSGHMLLDTAENAMVSLPVIHSSDTKLRFIKGSLFVAVRYSPATPLQWEAKNLEQLRALLQL